MATLSLGVTLIYTKGNQSESYTRIVVFSFDHDHANSVAHLTRVLATMWVPSTDHGLFIYTLSIPVLLGTHFMVDVPHHYLAEFIGTTSID